MKCSPKYLPTLSFERVTTLCLVALFHVNSSRATLPEICMTKTSFPAIAARLAASCGDAIQSMSVSWRPASTSEQMGGGSATGLLCRPAEFFSAASTREGAADSKKDAPSATDAQSHHRERELRMASLLFRWFDADLPQNGISTRHTAPVPRRRNACIHVMYRYARREASFFLRAVA